VQADGAGHGGLPRDCRVILQGRTRRGQSDLDLLSTAEAGCRPAVIGTTNEAFGGRTVLQIFSSLEITAPAASLLPLHYGPILKLQQIPSH
jgi:hypothetical protein